MSELNLAQHLLAQARATGQTFVEQGSGGPSPAEGLQLFKAFAGIQDATLRRSVIHLVELLGAAAGKR
jgi:hypothetical protein